MTGQLPGCRADPQRQAAGCVPVQLHQRPLAPVTVLARDRAHDRAYCLKIFSFSEKIYARYAAGYLPGPSPLRWCAAAAPRASTSGASDPATRSRRSSSRSYPAAPSRLQQDTVDLLHRY